MGNLKFNMIFPSVIGKTNIERDFTVSEIDYVLELSKTSVQNTGNMNSHNSYVLNENPFKDIKNLIQSYLNNYLEAIINPKYEVEIYITQSWLNFTNFNEYHHPHKHPNSFLSGVLYISADELNDAIKIYKSEYNQILIEPKDYNLSNSTSWSFPVKTGDIIIFPSNLKHEVFKVCHKNTRISLAFNSFVSGRLGEQFNLTELFL